MIYTIRRCATPSLDHDWPEAEEARIAQFHPRSSDHRPTTRAKVLYDERSLYVRFDVRDQFVRCVHSGYQAPVCRDSCVEFFVGPREGKGYFNFEFNCGGAMLLFYIEDASRTDTSAFAKYEPVPQSLGTLVRVRSSLPKRVEPEIGEPIDWSLACEIPLKLFEPYVGTVAPKAGDAWRGNFFKCGDETSHPHWASWSPIGEVLRFHQPDKFGVLRFA